MAEVKDEVKYEENVAESGDAEANGENAKSAIEEPEQFRKLFIGGLSLNTTDESLREFYGQFGTIVDCIVMRDGGSKKSRGFGFVSFSAKNEVDAAMTSRPHVIDQKTVDPKRAVPREQSSRGEANVSTMRLYVSGVREEHTEEEFREYFSEFGNVMKAEIITDKQTNKPRGFGFITFDDYDPVDKCVLKKSHMIKGYRCDVKKALSRDEMARAQQMDRDRQERGGRMRGGGRTGGPMGGGRDGGWQSRGGPAGSFREPHGGYGGGGGGGGPWSSGGGYSGGGGGGPGAWGGAPQGNWGGYGAPPQGYGGGGYGSSGGSGGGWSDQWGGGPSQQPQPWGPQAGQGGWQSQPYNQSWGGASTGGVSSQGSGSTGTGGSSSGGHWKGAGRY